jgi:hypothetical protein
MGMGIRSHAHVRHDSRYKTDNRMEAWIDVRHLN